MIKPHRRPRTYSSYADTVRLHLKPRLGHHQLAKLTAAQVQAMINTMAATGGTRIAQYTRGVLQQALNRAVKWDLVSRNVVLATDRPRNIPRTITPLTEEQAQQLLEAVTGHRLEALYRLALALGLRRGEVLALRWVDINLDQQTLQISGSLQRVQGKLVRSEPKTKAGARTFLLPEVLVELLADHQRQQVEERQIWGEEWADHGLVFPAERGTPLEPRNLHRHFKLALKRAGLPVTTRFHDLRHSCATFLIAQGVHPRVVMEILGHSQISLTMNTYGHVQSETQRDATSKVAGMFGKRKPRSQPDPANPEKTPEAEPGTSAEPGEPDEVSETRAGMTEGSEGSEEIRAAQEEAPEPDAEVGEG